MTTAELREKLHAMFTHASKHGSSITIVIETDLPQEVGISVPTGASIATIDKMICDALERLDRKASA